MIITDHLGCKSQTDSKLKAPPIPIIIGYVDWELSCSRIFVCYIFVMSIFKVDNHHFYANMGETNIQFSRFALTMKTYIYIIMVGQPTGYPLPTHFLNP